MNAYFFLLNFRFRQFGRALKEVGWGYLLFFIPMALIFCLYVLEVLDRSEASLGLVLVYPLLISAIHFNRNDFLFLKKTNLKLPLVFALEYSILVLPVSILFLIVGKESLAALGQLLTFGWALALGSMPFFIKKTRNNWNLSFLPTALFEWKTTIRTYSYFFILIWAIGFACAFQRVAFVVFVVLFASFIAATFKALEGKEILVQQPDLQQKIGLNTLFLNLLFLPHYVVYLICSPSSWYLLVGAFCYLLLYQTYCIVYKYAQYHPRKRSVNNEMTSAFFIMLCPFLPVSIPMVIWYFIKAKQNLNYARS